jgi:photosystem II stability/assembly factor-like uncharacterized protein
MDSRVFGLQTRMIVSVLLSVACGLASESVGQVETKNAVDDHQKPTWQMMDVDTKASLRGLHVLDAKHIFASGTGGTVVQSRDGGKSWNVQTVPGAESLDFRDIHAIDRDNLVIMSSGSPARMYRSKDGGKLWTKTFERTDEKFFLDAVAFWDDNNGLVMGDPIDGRVLLLRTTDGGNSWQQVENTPKLLPGEAGFAASGTNMITVGKNKVLIALGGAPKDQTIKTSRVLVSSDRAETWQAASLLLDRSPSAGIFSLHFIDDENGIAVGGDYKKETSTTGTIAITQDGGQSWSVPAESVPAESGANQSTPSGFRSCVVSFPYSVIDQGINNDGSACLSVGPNGTDYSTDQGRTWIRVSETGFHAIDFGNAIWASGSQGRIGTWRIQKQSPNNEPRSRKRPGRHMGT